MTNQKLSDGSTSCIYGYSKNNKLIGLGNHIGKNGENLTITVLSCNRSSSTIKLINSIIEHMPNFKGDCLIIDNGSIEEELANVYLAIETLGPHFRVVELKDNYGVAGGRNRSIEHIQTEWFMNLDNDIYFVDNPLESINEALMTLGCKFLNMPLLNETADTLFTHGGSLFVDNDGLDIILGCGSLYKQEPCQPGTIEPFSLGTFLFGGASVINKKAFIDNGMFDDNMFVGFEDYDFSLTLFRAGLKIGNCGHVALVHDHRVPENTNDVEYEKVRFSNKRLYEAALYFEKKNGIKVWSKITEEWLIEKQESLELGITTKKKEKKKKIAIVLDNDTWAFSNITREIQKYLNEDFEFKVIPMNIIDDNIFKLFIMVQDCDLVHFFWRGHLNFIDGEFTKGYSMNSGLSFDFFKEHYIKNKIITTDVYDHNFLVDDTQVNRNVLAYAQDYFVSSNILYDIYMKVEGINKPSRIITDGIDLDKFVPRNLERFDDLDRTIVIGWVGNSKFNNNDLKGVNSILIPALEELIEEGYDIKMNFADRNVKMISHDEMPNYYNCIDLYVCTSSSEGTPNPVLESMASGIPVISTHVGIVPEAFGEKQKHFILEERSKECLKAKIIELLNDKKQFKELSIENLVKIKEWTWEKKCQQFKQFFESNLIKK